MTRDKQEGPRSGAFLLRSVLHFCSGQPLLNHSGVDTRTRSLEQRYLERLPLLTALMKSAAVARVDEALPPAINRRLKDMSTPE